VIRLDLGASGFCFETWGRTSYSTDSAYDCRQDSRSGDRTDASNRLSPLRFEKPTPAEGQVLIRVHAASVNPYDWHFLRGTPTFIRLFIGMRKPKSPRLGADVAGVVEAVGAKVAPFKPGDAVFGTAKGSFAEYACAAASQLAVKPQEISFEQAACLPIAGITALQGMRDKGKFSQGKPFSSTARRASVPTLCAKSQKLFAMSSPAAFAAKS
jgi:NADPH:quinone reductase-like Zn-dependent oxidoreductase